MLRDGSRAIQAEHRIKRRTRLRTRKWFTILLCLAILLTVYIGVWLAYRKINRDFYMTLPIIQVPPAKRVLVIAPHNDDEMLSNSVLVKHLIDQGSDVSFAIITNGDGFTPDIILSSKKVSLVGSDYIRLGMLRQRETLNGLALLGIPADKMRFFGYPDRGCEEMMLFNWYEKAPYFDPLTKSDRVPYQNSFGDMPALAGENMLKDMKTVLKDVAPDLIIMPHPYDENVDHAAANAMMQLALSSLGLDQVPQILYLTHHALNTWPQPLYPANAGPCLVPPVNLRFTDTEWQVLPITKEEEQLAHDIIAQYPSQLIVDNAFLHSFVRNNELFAAYHPPALAYGKHKSEQIQPSEDNQLIATPSGGILSLASNDGWHIKTLHGEISTDGFLHLILKMENDVDTKAIYQFMLISESHSGEISHSTITVQNGQVYEVGFGYAIDPVQIEGAWIDLSIPYAAFGDIRACIIQASVCNYERVVSKTIWQALMIPAQIKISQDVGP